MTIEEYYTLLAPKITHMLIATGTPYHLACDIVQDTFIKLWKIRDRLKLDEPNSLSGLAFSMARNLRIDYIRHGKFMIYEDEILDSVVTEKTTASSDLLYLRNRIQQALAQLPAPLSETYSLFQLGELSIHEIAKITHVSESLVKVRIFRAKQRLKILLEDLQNI